MRVDPPPAGSPLRDLVVVGGGLSGLSLAHFARSEAGVEDVTVLEAAPRPGGKIESRWVDGFCCEWGPQGFLDNAPDTLALVRQLGLASSLVRADPAAKERFIVRDNVLRSVPASPLAFLASSALSLPGRLRVLLEPFAGRGEEEESVLTFARRRIGREAAEVLVDAMVTGVFAGDPARLSLPATFPLMRRMEAEHGSLVRAMLAGVRRRRRGTVGGPMGPAGTLTTFAGGMQQLVDALAATLAARLRCNAPVLRVHRTDQGFAVTLGSGETLLARRVAVAVPPGAARRLLAPVLPPEAAAALDGIPTVPVAVVMTGYATPRPFAHLTRGFGFLVPGREGSRVLGSIFCHSVFPHEAPAGRAFLRTLVGGARRSELAALDDDALLALVREELDRLLGGDPEPTMVRIVRHREAIPQYTLGHRHRLAVLQRAVEQVPGLELLGNGYRGIAANACIADARTLAGRLRSP